MLRVLDGGPLRGFHPNGGPKLPGGDRHFLALTLALVKGGDDTWHETGLAFVSTSLLEATVPFFLVDGRVRPLYVNRVVSG